MGRHVTLLQRFSLITLATTAVIAAILGWQITAGIEQTAIERARNDLADAVRSRKPFWLDASDPRAELSRPHTDPADYDRWKSATDVILAGYPIFRVKVWSPASRIIWSDSRELIGETHPENEELREALEGLVKSEITDLSKLENRSDGVQGRIMELYVPILPRESFEVAAVFEVYQEVDDLYDAIEQAQMQAWTLIVVLMGAFYLALFTMMSNASRLLSKLQRVAQLERYFSPAVAQAIASRGPGKQQGPLNGRAEATVMFTDIRGFTRHAERMEPEKVVTMLSDYVDLVTKAVFAHGGSVDKFLGDGVLAVFGAPLARPGHAGKAVRAAADIRQALAGLNSTRVASGEPPIQIGVALATGEVVTGVLGSQMQLAYTVVGDTVNLASRLVGIARPGEVLVTSDTFGQASRSADTEAFDFQGPFTLRVRGRVEPVTIYAAADPGTSRETPDETGFTVRHIVAAVAAR